MSEIEAPLLPEIYGLLGNQRRLLTIRYLSMFNCGATVEVRHVARVVRGIELGISPQNVGTADYESAYNSLIQLHLPKLAGRGLIEYDVDRKTITTRAKIDQYAFLASVGQFVVRPE